MTGRRRSSLTMAPSGRSAAPTWRNCCRGRWRLSSRRHGNSGGAGGCSSTGYSFVTWNEPTPPVKSVRACRTGRPFGSVQPRRLAASRARRRRGTPATPLTPAAAGRSSSTLAAAQRSFFPNRVNKRALTPAGRARLPRPASAFAARTAPHRPACRPGPDREQRDRSRSNCQSPRRRHRAVHAPCARQPRRQPPAASGGFAPRRAEPAARRAGPRGLAPGDRPIRSARAPSRSHRPGTPRRTGRSPCRNPGRSRTGTARGRRA